jgi:N-acetyl-anhydromuramyl-L-alanine amidase AmpD
MPYHLLPCPARFLVLRSLVLLLVVVLLPLRSSAQSAAPDGLSVAFQQAAQEWDVPRDLLVTIAYAETHFDDHDGQPSVDNGFGLMHLVDNPQTQTLVRAARLLGVGREILKTDSRQNVRGGAALLRAYADEQKLSDESRRNLAAWYPVVAQYSNAQDILVAREYADEVYRLLNLGVRGVSPEGETIVVPPQAIEPDQGKYGQVMRAQARSVDYPDAFWVAAHATNYMIANRERDYPINYIVIHTTQGTYASAINWFHMDHGTAGPTSAHYVIRSRDGEITQTVREKDVAYHAGNWTYNTQSIGIEHEGWINDPHTWYTDAMYKASARLTRTIARKYGIPLDRSHIIGHNEVPGATHTDPGSGWNWSYYMQLVQQDPTVPPTLTRKIHIPLVQAVGQWSIIIDNTDTQQFSASSSWDVATYNVQYYGDDYRVAAAQPVADAAWFRATIPRTDTYDIFVWYPASSAYNSATPFVIKTATGNQIVRINQQANGGQWVSLGSFALDGGNNDVVGVSRWSSEPGYIIADAVKIVQR